ncbi:DnaJ domain protein (macronuclear) [Tetrahymena thermophila SB210]|uniref:DnaJ domain protein n=1 Tax=Tetrahymena thermophila (strain SB210) TaxID=312017 RepID=Q22GV1_TETTS|nr:DnaJ domain protein [Tetrahymena thermophila SB210]EAR84573.1 DnaJ domain protein [Tetrahymena thermophila SB210]|eukprot:XP_001032236.1 DnaJ domain protein [Tetrahymena thermophila SB210]
MQTTENSQEIQSELQSSVFSFFEEIKGKFFGPKKVEEVKVFEPDVVKSVEELQVKILESSQTSPFLSDFEKKCFRNLDYSYKLDQTDNFFKFYNRLIYSVHPRILEQEQKAKEMTWSQVFSELKDFQKKKVEYLREKYKNQKNKQEEEDDDDEVNEQGYGGDIFGQQKEKVRQNDDLDKLYDIGTHFKYFKKEYYTNQAKIDQTSKNFDIVVYKDSLEDIDPLYATYPKHDIPIIDLFLVRLEKFQLWSSTRIFSMGFLCTFPILVGMVLARQVPKNLGGADLFKTTVSKFLYKGGFQDKMNRREAALILNLKQNATKEEIRKSHRKMMMTNHPDNGGSQYVATKINEAKELMLKGDI